MKLHTFIRQKSESDPYAPYIKFVSVPKREDFQTGEANFIFRDVFVEPIPPIRIAIL